jgi:hypothetical protein
MMFLFQALTMTSTFWSSKSPSQSSGVISLPLTFRVQAAGRGGQEDGRSCKSPCRASYYHYAELHNSPTRSLLCA